MPDTVSQPTAAPTRKVLVGSVAGVATAAVLSWADNIAGWSPDWAGFLSNPEVTPMVGVVVFAAVAYWFKERS